MADGRSTSDGERPLAVVALAALAVVAAVLTAAAVAPVFSEETGGDRPPRLERPEANASADQPTGGSSVPFRPIWVALMVLGAIAVAAQAAADPWGTLKTLLAVAAFVGLGYLLVRALANRDVSVGRQGGGGGPPPPAGTATPNGSAGFDRGASTAFSWPVETIAVAAVAAAAVAVVALVLWRPDTVRSALGLATGDGSATDSDLEAVGRVAGSAADRVETAATPRAADNAIYRAWSEMVALLGAPDPQSGTPRQFEAAAVESGMDPEDVHVLTRTFEEVRYGDAALSPERRERATAALRRIERTHGEESEAGSPGGASDADETRSARDAGTDRDSRGAGTGGASDGPGGGE